MPEHPIVEAVSAALREAAHKIETIAYRDVARAIRESSPDVRVYGEALRVFRAHVKPLSLRAYRHGHTTTQTAAALRLAATELVQTAAQEPR